MPGQWTRKEAKAQALVLTLGVELGALLESEQEVFFILEAAVSLVVAPSFRHVSLWSLEL